MPDDNATEIKVLKATLGDVRKGKPRNFAIFAEGSDVLGLILSKKGISNGVLLDAKKAAKAKKVLTGVALGKGAEVTFYATDAIPIKPAALKTWIATATGAKISVEFRTVADLSSIGKAAPTAKTPATDPAGTGKTDDKSADAKPSADAKVQKKPTDAKKQATRKAQLVTALAALIKTRSDRLDDDVTAAALAKGARVSLAKGDLDIAEKAVKALDKATKAKPKVRATPLS